MSLFSRGELLRCGMFLRWRMQQRSPRFQVLFSAVSSFSGRSVRLSDGLQDIVVSLHEGQYSMWSLLP
jgi:hypothetical protein